MKKILFILTIITSVGCINKDDKKITLVRPSSSADSAPKNYIDTIGQLEDQSVSINYDSLGQFVSTIRFDVKTNNSEDYENGIIPSIRIDSPQNDIKNLIGKDEIVIAETKLTVVIDYPLSSSYKFEITSPDGFTRRQLINEISKHYYQLYAEEEKSATIKTIPMKDRKIFNRNQTNGKYGIWGHDIGDLVLDEIQVYKSDKGEIFVTLQIES